jgi:hypothetical protein
VNSYEFIKKTRQQLMDTVRIENERLQAIAAELGLPKPTDRQGYEGQHTAFTIIEALRSAHARTEAQLREALAAMTQERDAALPPHGWHAFCQRHQQKTDDRCPRCELEATEAQIRGLVERFDQWCDYTTREARREREVGAHIAEAHQRGLAEAFKAAKKEVSALLTPPAGADQEPI